MKEIKLTKKELERLIYTYAPARLGLVKVCKDLGHADEESLYEIYKAFCRYLQVDGLRIYKMDEFNSLKFANNEEQKRLTANVDLDDHFFAMDLYGLIGGYKSFSDLHSYLQYRIPLSLRIINDMLEFTFEDEEEGEEDEK